MLRRNSARVPRRTRNSRTPSIWDAVTMDVCSRTVTLLSSRYSVATLLAILDRVGVNASRLPMGHPLHDRSVRLFTMEDLRRNPFALLARNERTRTRHPTLRSRLRPRHDAALD